MRLPLLAGNGGLMPGPWPIAGNGPGNAAAFRLSVPLCSRRPRQIPKEHTHTAGTDSQSRKGSFGSTRPPV